MTAETPSPALDISPYLELVGKDLPQPQQFNYEVSRDSIRHFAHAVDDYSALYLDDEFARSTRWGGVIASPGYLSSHGQSSWIIGQLPPLTGADGQRIGLSAHAGDDWHFVRPARPGDVILAHSKLEKAEAKSGRNMGSSVRFRLSTHYSNQHGEHVATRGGTYFRLGDMKGGAGSGALYPPLDHGQSRNVIQPTRFPGTFELPPLRKDTDRFHEDVQVGDRIPALRIPPTYLQNLGRYNAATIGTGVDEVGGPHGGMPDAYVFGHLRIPWFARLLSTWAGPNAWISTLSQQSKQWMLIGFEAVLSGEVTAKGTDGERAWVDLRLQCDCELGFTTNTGTARVELMRRHAPR